MERGQVTGLALSTSLCCLGGCKLRFFWRMTVEGKNDMKSRVGFFSSQCQIYLLRIGNAGW